MGNETGGTVRSFVVVLRARSAARFLEGEGLEIRDFPSALGPVNVIFRTRYVDEGFHDKVPRDLWIEVRGRGGSLDEVINPLAGAAASLLLVIALATNATIRDPIVHLAYEDTPGVHEREFFEAFVPDEKGLPLNGRRVPIEAASALVRAISEHREQVRLLRAVGQYYAALMNWDPGMETMSLAHLYMDMEALTKACIRHECDSRGLTEDELAAELGVEKKKLDPTVRLKLLFRGDNQCYNKAKEASDGLEHGFLDFIHIRTLAAEVREKTAEYLRSAILALAGGGAEKFAAIRSGKYAEVLGAWHVVKYFRGVLGGDGPHLAEAGQEYPFFTWSSKIKELHRTPAGEYQVVPDETFTARLGPGITLLRGSLEMWGPKQSRPPQRLGESTIDGEQQPEK